MRIASRSVSSAPHCHTPCYGFQAMPPALGGVVFTSGTGKRPCPRGKAHRMDICFAHTLSGEPPDRWQPLEAHLRGFNIKATSAMSQNPQQTTAWLKAQLGNRVSQVRTDSYVGLFSSQHRKCRIDQTIGQSQKKYRRKIF